MSGPISEGAETQRASGGAAGSPLRAETKSTRAHVTKREERNTGRHRVRNIRDKAAGRWKADGKHELWNAVEALVWTPQARGNGAIGHGDGPPEFMMHFNT